ncbi:hypothetical protein EGW08_016351 [Elysia chlorotica]|uniref:Uncharacterized protein n=1 Tax=Elysia chlorotica TaxID=188477 RepID=A0A433T2W7_ELYCH|nr:hypothetical protein EGW08_016351 [Elysia chlorotica]
MEGEKMRKQKQDMDLDIQQLKARQMREKQERDDEKKKNYEILTKTFPWDQRSHGHGGPRGSGNNRRRKFLETDFSPRNQEGFKDKRETDLFLDTLGGPGGTVLRTGTGSPSLTDPKFLRQQQNFQAATSPRGAGGMTPQEMHEYTQKLDQVSEERKIMKQQKRIQELRDKIDGLKENQGQDNRPQGYINGRLNERRSLDLENTLGGAGAPIKNTDGKKVTRMPITLRRDDYGESKITEDIPGKANFNFDFTEDENKPYYPWGGQGGGAPIRDREGKVKTMIYGQLESKNNYSGDFRRAKRRQEVLYNELKEGERQQKQNKEELDRYMKAPQAELADVLAAGRVGKPRRDEITGEISQHHLPNSDVTLVKMNHQPKPMDEKKNYHDELVKMAEERQHLKQLEKLKERQESNAHFRNMDSTWGAFGGGAPKHMQIRKKANLTNSLFYPDLSQDESVPSHSMTLDPQNPPTGLGSFMQESPIDKSSMLNMEPSSMMFASQNTSPRYVKSTINSSHKNMFETTNEQRMMRAQGYNQPLAPYATRGGY